MQCRWWIVWLIVATTSAQALAECPSACTPFCHSSWLSPQVWPRIGCCPDDYVRKPCINCLVVPRCGTCDDYCRKPMPCVPLTRCGSEDDYCRKPMPTLLCPRPSEYM